LDFNINCSGQKLFNALKSVPKNIERKNPKCQKYSNEVSDIQSVKGGKKEAKSVQSSSKWSNVVQIGPNQSKAVQCGPKWSKVIKSSPSQSKAGQIIDPK
jgi:hypothetical protein